MHILCAISAPSAPVCGYGGQSDKSYVSPYVYVPLSCVQLADAGQVTSVRTAQTGGTQDQTWTRDTIATTADGVVSSRPTLLVGGGEQTTSELAGPKQ